MSFIALVDCNNFFVSCERVFNPKLIGKPVVVLSCNDGCIIARSQEAKAIGVPMGAPYFQWADFLRVHNVAVCSSNFTLYADLSNRVMQTLSYFNPELEIYSVDEAFLLMEKVKDPVDHCRNIKKKVLQWTGIPVSLGIATTKTLAKVANQFAKKEKKFQEVCFPSQNELELILNTLPVGEIWGIGYRLSKFLAKRGIYTAGQLRDMPDLWIKNTLSVVGLRTVWELRGISCLDIEEVAIGKKSIMTSRSFGRPVLNIEELREAVCSYAAKGAEKLRGEGKLANWLQVFITTNFHNEKTYANSIQLMFEEPTDYTPKILNIATQGLKRIFRQGFAYKKAGVLLGGLVSPENYQQNLFVKQDLEKAAKHKIAMSLLDMANTAFGYKILQFASEGTKRPWQMKKEMCSACYTTRWSDLLTIHI